MARKVILAMVLILEWSVTLVWPQQRNLTFELDQLKEKAKPEASELLPAAEPLEMTIEPEEYIVGPGDVLAISIWGPFSANYTSKITPEGTLLIPTVGDINLKQMTLAQAKKRIEEKVKIKYINSEVSVTLLAIRKFRVTVSGAVRNPGTVIVSAVDRVSDAIKQANLLGVTEQKPQEITKRTARPSEGIEKSKEGEEWDKLEGLVSTLTTSPEASRRNIKLTRKDGITITVDLHRYQVTGNKQCNPLLLEGDIIQVPVVEPDVGVVGIYGAVKVPGVYEYVKGDGLEDIIALAHGLTEDADPSHIEISRFDKNNQTTVAIKVDLQASHGGDNNTNNRNIPIQPDDRIYIRFIPDYHRKSQVSVRGEVIYPGEYTVEEGKTRLSDVISRAGGFTRNASLAEASIIRRAYEDVQDLEFERLSKMLIEDMTEQEREYFKIKSRERKGIVAVDFEKLFLHKDASHDILLRDKDLIIVPMFGRTVNVSGQVGHSGLVEYVPGKDLDYYVKKAGGYSWNANRKKVRVIRASTGEWVKPKRNTKIELGDTIFVPEKPEIKWWEVFKDVMRVSAEIATVIIVIQQVSK